MKKLISGEKKTILQSDYAASYSASMILDLLLFTKVNAPAHKCVRSEAYAGKYFVIAKSLAKKPFSKELG